MIPSQLPDMLIIVISDQHVSRMVNNHFLLRLEGILETDE